MNKGDCIHSVHLAIHLSTGLIPQKIYEIFFLHIPFIFSVKYNVYTVQLEDFFDRKSVCGKVIYFPRVEGILLWNLFMYRRQVKFDFFTFKKTAKPGLDKDANKNMLQTRKRVLNSFSKILTYLDFKSAPNCAFRTVPRGLFMTALQ